MRPGPRIWASNAVWAGGPDVGLATKVPMSAGELAEGRYRSIRPAPQLDNYEFWAQSTRLHGAVSMRTLNPLTAFDLSTIGAGWGANHIALGGVWDPSIDTATVMALSSAPAFEEILSVGGFVYAAGAPPGAPGAAGVCCDLAISVGTGVRGLVAGIGGAGQNPLCSVGYAAWAGWGGGTPNATYYSIDRNEDAGVWATIRSTGALLISSGPGVGFAAPPTPPGFAACTSAVIRTSNHVTGDVYPDDPGNNHWIALTDTEFSRTSSADPLVWTAAAAHGYAGTPTDAAYCKATGRWICSMVGAANGTIGISDDGGATWAAAVTVHAGFSPVPAHIACDGFGDWMAVFRDAANAFLYASWDDGETWHQVYLPTGPISPATALFYGGGRFHLVDDDGAGNGYVSLSLRAEE